jgi:hypothetical protein
MYLAITNVKALPNSKLLLTFKNNESRILDMSPYLNKGIYSELKDVNLFNSVRVCFDSIEWANVADVDPEFVYSESIPVDSHNVKVNA